MKMSRFVLVAVAAASSLFAKEDQRVAIVNFTSCVLESEFGKIEQENFESVKNQMATLIQECEKQLTEIAGRFNDADYMDGLSPEAEAELKAKYQAHSEEYGRYQNQYMQVLNQANMRMIQKMQEYVNSASEKIARNEKFDLILNKEAAFYFSNALDITPLVIKEMNLEYEMSGKKPPLEKK